MLISKWKRANDMSERARERERERERVETDGKGRRTPRVGALLASCQGGSITITSNCVSRARASINT
jgi:hypothetical protein